MDLCFDVVNQTVTRTEKNRTVNYSDDYLRLVFDFKSDDWSDCSKFILFFDGEEVYRMALSNDAYIVPEELLTTDKLLFSVYGVNNSYRVTTPKILVRLLEAGYSSDVKDLDVDEFTHDVVEEVYLAIDGKADSVHTHIKSEITDFSHTHTKSDITDFSHTHTKSEITDFNHNHDDRYYTETEVDAIVSDLENRLNNKIKLDADKMIIQSNDTVEFRAFLMKDGMPVKNATIEFYKGSD